MITKNVTGELSATTNREWQIRESWYVITDTSGKEGLTETSRPGLIPIMRSNHPEKTQSLTPQNPLWGILLLRLEGTHLHTEDRVFDGGHYTLL